MHILQKGFILLEGEWKEQLSQEQKILTLTRAGLTVLQAKVYLALTTYGRQTVKDLAGVAKIDRSNTYREVLKLQRIGLVVRKIDTPNLYEAIPLESAISHLLACKQEEYEKTKKDAEDLLKSCKGPVNSLKENTDEDFFLIPKNCGFKKTSINNIRKAQVSNDTISCLKRLSQALPESSESQKIALKNGVRTRMIIDKPPNMKSISRQIWDLLEYPNFELRYTLEPPKVLGVCFDDKTASILINPSADIWDSSVLVTSHQSFVTLFQTYFNSLWNSAVPIQKKRSNKPKRGVFPTIATGS
jgi:sugar-specific transcriptional regulator TrmB